MRINILRKDEECVGIYNGYLMIRHKKKGEMRLVKLINDEMGIRISPEDEVIIGYGDGTVVYGDMDDRIEVTTF